MKIKDIKFDYELDEIELGQMIVKLIPILKKENPDYIIVYGDTRSALAGALSANELKIKLVHIEAGMRNYCVDRPEEKIRIVIDHLSCLLFCPTVNSMNNLDEENIQGKAYLVGDLNYDSYVKNREHLDYTVLTLHRQEHMKKGLIKEILKLKGRVIFPIHPRTKKFIEENKIKVPKNIEIIDPVNYKDMLKLIKHAKLVITDSGGVSKEAWFSGVPVKIIGQSEWPEINAFGDGNAEQKIKDIIQGDFYGRTY